MSYLEIKIFFHKLVDFEKKLVKNFLSRISLLMPRIILDIFGKISWCYFMPGVVACTCNPATLEVEFRNGVGSIPVGGNSSLIGGWIVWPPVIQH